MGAFAKGYRRTPGLGKSFQDVANAIADWRKKKESEEFNKQIADAFFKQKAEESSLDQQSLNSVLSAAPLAAASAVGVLEGVSQQSPVPQQNVSPLAKYAESAKAYQQKVQGLNDKLANLFPLADTPEKRASLLKNYEIALNMLKTEEPRAPKLINTKDGVYAWNPLTGDIPNKPVISVEPGVSKVVEDKSGKYKVIDTRGGVKDTGIEAPLSTPSRKVKKIEPDENGNAVVFYDDGSYEVKPVKLGSKTKLDNGLDTGKNPVKWEEEYSKVWSGLESYEKALRNTDGESIILTDTEGNKREYPLYEVKYDLVHNFQNNLGRIIDKITRNKKLSGIYDKLDELGNEKKSLENYGEVAGVIEKAADMARENKSITDNEWAQILKLASLLRKYQNILDEIEKRQGYGSENDMGEEGKRGGEVYQDVENANIG